MSLLITLAREDELSLQEQIYRSIRDRVLSGAYPTGLRLPSTRDLAIDIGVSRTTVLLAYEWLMSEGYIETFKGVGTFVCNVVVDAVRAARSPEHRLAMQPKPSGAGRLAGLPTPLESLIVFGKDNDRPKIDFWYGRPDYRQFPIKAWRRLIMQELAGQTSGLADYSEQAGDPALRAAISEHISTTRGFLAGPERIVITSGAQEALNIISRMLIKKSVEVAIENPGYASAAAIFESYEAKLVPIPVDRDGICVDGLEGVGAKLVYATPSHQFPTGVIMSLERRQRLLAWARSTGAFIIEDDYDSEIIYDRPPLAALAALDQHETVIYVGSFSKSLGAGLRIGFMILPHDLVERAVAIKSLTSYGQSWLEQAALAALMRGGGFRAHLRRIRKVYRGRRDALIAALRNAFGDEIEISGESSGLHLVWTLPPNFPDADELTAEMHKLGVGLYSPARAGALQIGSANGTERRLLMGYSALATREIEQAVRKIAVVVGRAGQQTERTGRISARGIAGG